MDRGDDSLSAVINALQRDMEEIKTGQNRTAEVTTDMIQNSAVTTPKIADDAITTAKIADRAVDFDKIRWASIAGWQGVMLGEFLIQSGTAQLSSTNATNDFTVNLNTSYGEWGNTDYVVILTPEFPETGSSYWWAYVTGKTDKSFTCRAGYKSTNSGTGGGGNAVVNWVTLGFKVDGE